MASDEPLLNLDSPTEEVSGSMPTLLAVQHFAMTKVGYRPITWSLHFDALLMHVV